MKRPYTFDRVVRIFFSVCGIVAAIYVLDLLSPVLLPFFVAFLIAYILEPWVRLNKKILHCRKRFFPVMLTIVEAVVLISVIGWLIVPYLVDECAAMTALIRDYASNRIQIPYISREIHEFIRENIDLEQIGRLLSREQWTELIKNSLGKTWSFIGSSVSFIIGLVSWMVVLLYLVFIMLDFDKMSRSFRRLIPYGQREQVMQILRDIETSANRYFRGQFCVAASVGVLFSIGFLIIGLPMAVIFGLFIGLLNMVPYLQLVSLPIAAFLCLVGSIGGTVDFWVLFWETMAVYVVVQCIQDFILTPKIMGKAMGLNPAVILLSLSIWGSLLGFLGLIIALPLTTLILSYYDLYIVRRSLPDSQMSDRSDQSDLSDQSDQSDKSDNSPEHY
ncbi:MAG: AI-2E family transporter [Muribaculaceae bacterium]|nr:AI-2E family transporter [Muribaculaceae bacterium]